MNKSFEELKSTQRLPSPPGIVMELLRLTRDPNCSATDVAKVVQPDPALTGRILHMANSAAQGGTSVTTVAEATVRLGLNAVGAIALGFSLVTEHRRGHCEAFGYDEFWSRSLARAVVFQLLAQRLRCGDPSEMFVCGLLSNIGQLALVTAHPSRYAELLAAESDPALGAELDEFGIDRREATACLLEDWGLPERVFEMIRGCWELPEAEGGRPGPSALSHAGVPIAEALLNPQARSEQPTIEAELSVFQRWDPGSLPDLWDLAMREWHHWGASMQIPTNQLEAPAPLEPTPSAQTMVLAVDDDPTSLRMLEVQLAGNGYDVVTATNGREALRLAVERNPHIVVADWMMPDMDGVELCRALRTYDAGQHTYVILVTGEDKEERILEAFDAGVDDYVVKPYRPKLLLARVKAGVRVVSLQEKIEADRVTMESQVAELGILTRNLEIASLTDALTSLPNRRQGIDVLEQMWDRAAAEKVPLSAVMIDIDHFKRFNDEHGHDVGDAVLVQVATALSKEVRGQDLLFRYGGEEFCVLLSNGDLEAAERCAERLRTAVEGTRLTCGEVVAKATVSLGVAARTSEMDRPEEMLKAADEALYRAKHEGRNRVCGPAPALV